MKDKKIIKERFDKLKKQEQEIIEEKERYCNTQSQWFECRERLHKLKPIISELEWVLN